MPRIPPLAPDERDEETQRILGDAPPGVSSKTANLRTTLARHPSAFAAMMPFGTILQNGVLPTRTRELLIMRTGWNCRCEYEWSQHSRIAREVGFSDDDIVRIGVGPDAGWDEFDAAILRAVDELHIDAKISDNTWAVLTTRYSDKEMIELCMLVGLYHLVAYNLNSLEVELDGPVDRFPEV